MNPKSPRLRIPGGVHVLVTTALLAAGAIVLAGASPQDVGTAQPRLTAPATNDLSNTITNAVVLVGGGCSGTLIAPGIVLTAGHCLTKPLEGDWPGWFDQRAVWRPFTFPAFKNNSCCVTALRGEPGQTDRDLPGWDISSSTLPAPDPALCSARCTADASCQAWTFVRPGFQGPAAVCYLKRAGVTVSFGNNRSSVLSTAFASQYSMPGHNDIAMLRLDRAVPGTVAQPARVLTYIGAGQSPSSWLASHGFTFSGWGGGGLIRQTASAGFAEYQFSPFDKLEINMMRLTGRGGVALEPGDSGSPAFIDGPRCRSDISITERYVSGVAQGIQAAGGRFVATFAPGGCDPMDARQPNVGRWIASALYPPDIFITAVEATIVTGDDGLREGSNAFARVGLTGDRSVRINVNSGRSWGAGSTRTVILSVPPGTRVSDLVSFRIAHEGVPSSSTDSYDTWKIAAVHFAFRTGQQCPVNFGSRTGSPLVALTQNRRSWETTLVGPQP